VNVLASAFGTALAFKRVDLVDGKRGPLEFSVSLVDCLEMRMRADVDFVALVFEIAAFCDPLEVIGRVFLCPE
jgi:hypothetical protein